MMGGRTGRVAGLRAVVVVTSALAAFVAAPAEEPVMPPVMMERSFLMPALPMEPQYVPGTDEKFPRLRYADGQISLNDRCPVRHAKLNPKMAPVYVNGKPIGFC